MKEAHGLSYDRQAPVWMCVHSWLHVAVHSQREIVNCQEIVYVYQWTRANRIIQDHERKKNGFDGIIVIAWLFWANLTFVHFSKIWLHHTHIPQCLSTISIWILRIAEWIVLIAILIEYRGIPWHDNNVRIPNQHQICRIDEPTIWT